MRFVLLVFLKARSVKTFFFPFFNKPSQSFNKLLTKFQQPIIKA